jgi:uncharacterized protein
MRRIDREVTSISEIEEIILKADVCRLAFASDNIPYVVTMNFGYSANPKQTLFFHCANSGRKLDMIRKNKYVCFQMDIDHQLVQGKKSCDCGMKFSSLVGYGNISIVDEKEEKLKGLNCIVGHYGGEGENSFNEKVMERTTVLRLEILEISAKKC